MPSLTPLKKITTKAYGEIELKNESFYTFPCGILGFETLSQWAMFPAKEQPFYILQSLEQPEVAFFLINPLLFRPNYRPDPPLSDLETLNLETLTTQNSETLAIVNIRGEGLENITLNLQAPILFNKKNYRAVQTISTNPLWQIRHPLKK